MDSEAGRGAEGHHPRVSGVSGGHGAGCGHLAVRQRPPHLRRLPGADLPRVRGVQKQGGIRVQEQEVGGQYCKDDEVSYQITRQVLYLHSSNRSNLLFMNYFLSLTKLKPKTST